MFVCMGMSQREDALKSSEVFNRALVPLAAWQAGKMYDVYCPVLLRSDVEASGKPPQPAFNQQAWKSCNTLQHPPTPAGIPNGHHDHVSNIFPPIATWLAK